MDYTVDELLKNADNCADLRERTVEEPMKRRYARIERAWRDLAAVQAWLEGQSPPLAPTEWSLLRPECRPPKWERLVGLPAIRMRKRNFLTSPALHSEPGLFTLEVSPP